MSVLEGSSRKRRSMSGRIGESSYWPEFAIVLIGVIGTLVDYSLHGRHSERFEIAIIIGLVLMLVVEDTIDRVRAHRERGRVDAVVAAISDEELFEHVERVGECYWVVQKEARRSKHPSLYHERIVSLLKGDEWSNLSERRLEIRDEVKEKNIARDLLPTADYRVLAIARTADLSYLESPDGREYLERQALWLTNCEKKWENGNRPDWAAQSDALGFGIWRLFVWSPHDTVDLNMTTEEIVAKIHEIGAEHGASGIKCRIYQARVGETPPADSNVYDDHTVRYSIATIEGPQGYQQAVVSENEADVAKYTQEFRWRWNAGQAISPTP